MWTDTIPRKEEGKEEEIFNTKPDGVRSVRSPKLGWEDGVDQDIRILGGQELEESHPQQR